MKNLPHILLFSCGLLLASGLRAAEPAKPAPDDTISIADLRTETSAIFLYGSWDKKVAVTKSGLVVLGAKGAQGNGGFGHDLGSKLDFTAVTDIELALAVVPGNEVPHLLCEGISFQSKIRRIESVFVLQLIAALFAGK